MQKISPNEIIAIVAILLALASAYFVLRPLTRSLKDLNLKLAARSQEIQQAQEKLSLAKSLKTEFAANPDLANRLRVALPSSEALADLLIQIEALAAKSGTEVSSFQPSATIDKKETGTSFSLNLKGSYPSFVSFLENLEKNSRPILIKNLSLSGVAQGNSSIIAANLELEVFKVK